METPITSIFLNLKWGLILFQFSSRNKWTNGYKWCSTIMWVEVLRWDRGSDQLAPRSLTDSGIVLSPPPVSSSVVVPDPVESHGMAHGAVADDIPDELEANVWRQFMYIECILHVVMYVNEIMKFHFNFISTDRGDSKYYVWWFWPGQICRLKNNQCVHYLGCTCCVFPSWTV